MDRREREQLDRHITGNYGEDQFRDARDLVKALLRNNELLTREEENFRTAIDGLPNYKRAAAYKYVATLRERIRLLTEKVEELNRDLWAEFDNGSGEAEKDTRELRRVLSGESDEKRETGAK